ncbi:MAG TPA: 2Fe-2S iron-sulfur cluster-binding protein [bacterium]|nr:2Fe-2S iron-sulfur cluster-binding protein [bacterium]HQL61204.1 2Fe-2S iron-sulfur cluster-binding protein [bacterium]
MSESSVIHLTVNGQAVEGRRGQTILEICRAAGIYIPTLCYHPRLSVVAACRMCMVELEGNSKLQASCSTPAADGMVIRTDTEHLHEYRRLNLEFLFSERNHICPFCESSGACDLQRLGYEHKMESVRVEYLAPRLPTDLSSVCFGLDHNRCILCTRCIRVCDEIEGVHTLDLTGRGGKAMIGVDLHTDFGESTCTLCGACVQVCPTGALYDKLPAYRGRPQDLESVATTCPGCSVGCGLIAQTRYGQVIRVLGDENCPINRGHTCRIGRYDSVVIGRKRVEHPQVDSAQGWDSALAFCKQHLLADRQKKIVLALNSRTTLEACVEARNLLDTLGDNAIATLLDTDLPPQPVPAPGFDAIQKADVIWLVNCAPTRYVPVLASMLRRRVRKRQARLIVCTRRAIELSRYAELLLDLGPDEVAALFTNRDFLPSGLDEHSIRLLRECLQGNHQHLVITSDRPDRRGRTKVFADEHRKALRNAGVDLFHITVGTNTLGIAALLGDRLVDRKDLFCRELGAVVAVVGDLVDERVPAALKSLTEKAGFVLVLTSYEMEEPSQAVLPMMTWWEDGPAHVVNLIGNIRPVVPVGPPRGDARPLADILHALAVALGSKATRRNIDSIREELAQTWSKREEVAR